MQNRYAGDVGDFGKLGLLRCLSTNSDGGGALRLGIVWYLVPDELRGNDGKHIGYLKRTAKNERRFRSCDAELYDALVRIVSTDRSVSNIESAGVLPADTCYFNDELALSEFRTFGSSWARTSARQKWLSRSLECVKDCDLLFLDPDNGLEVPSVEIHHQRAPKYVFFEELKTFASLDGLKTLIVYQHLCRNGCAAEQIDGRTQEIKDQLGDERAVLPVVYRRGTQRVFFIISFSAQQEELLRSRVKKMLREPWSRHFSLQEV
jgi:hypothetical protein